MDPGISFPTYIGVVAKPRTTPSLDLAGKVVVITGGAQGIGRDLAHCIADLGGHIAVLDIIETVAYDLEELAKASGVKARYYCTDITKQEGLEQTIDDIVLDFGRIDGCVTAAGMLIVENFLETRWEDVVHTQMVNVIGTFMTAQYVARQMKRQSSGGSIVMISSVSAHGISPELPIAAYTAAKGAVKSLAHALAVELGPFDIRVNTISPGYIQTDMTVKVARTNPEMVSRFTYEPPLGRMGATHDLKGAVAFLLSSSASYVSGADIMVTGGLHAGRYTQERMSTSTRQDGVRML